MAMAINLFSPALIFAQETPTPKGFCTRVNEFTSRIDERITDREAKLQAKRQERANNLVEQKNKRDTLRSKNRVGRDENRQEHYTKLESRATTDAQKQAVVVFKTTVEAAVSARKAVVDNAIKAFRQSVDQSIASRKSAVDGAINTFKNAKIAAVEKAKADCAARVDPRTVRETFRTNMKAAQDKFKSDRQAIETLKDTFEPIRTARKQAVEKAIADFKMIMEKARTDLKATFPQ